MGGLAWSESWGLPLLRLASSLTFPPEGGAAATRLLVAARELTRYAGDGWHDKYLRKRAQSEWLGIMHAVAFMEFLLMVLIHPAGPHGTAVSIAGWDPAREPYRR